MLKLALFAAAASLGTAPAHASTSEPPASEAATSSAAEMPRGETASLAVALEFVQLVYPIEDTLAGFRQGWKEAIDRIEVEAVRVNMKSTIEVSSGKIEAVYARHFPAVQQAYAKEYARRFSDAELKDLVAFARTPTGRHYFADTYFADSSEDVIQAGSAIADELAPIYEELQKAMCQEKTKLRIAKGDTDAKCSMA